MAMHYTRSKENRELTLMDVANFSADESWEVFRDCRFGEGEIFQCPECCHNDKHRFIRTRKQWQCKHCAHRFSVTSGTPFENRKLSYKKILFILFTFITGAQGANANELPQDIGITYKSAYMNIAKIREVVYESMDYAPLKGIVHVDCMHICGKPRRSNKRKSSDSFIVNNRLRSRKDSIVPDQKTHPEPRNLEKLKNRRIVLALSQLALNDDGSYGSDRTITFVIRAETAQLILPLLDRCVDKSAIIMTDSGNAYNRIEPLLRNTHFAVNHSIEYQGEDGVNNNQAECFFSRMRRAEYGTFNGISKTYLAHYAAEFAYRNDSKYTRTKDRFYSLLSQILKKEPSKSFCRYFQKKQHRIDHCYY